MQYFILSNTIIIQSKTLYTIEPGDARHEPLLKLLHAEPLDTQAVQNLLDFKLSDRIGKSEIIDGHLCVDGHRIPEPFHTLLLNKKNEIAEYELIYNLYFSLSKSKKEQALADWAFFINNNIPYKIYGLNDLKILTQDHRFTPNGIFLRVVQYFNDEELKLEFKAIFDKNYFKYFKELIFKQNDFNLFNFKIWVSFIKEFKDSDDSLMKFLTHIIETQVSANYHFFASSEARSFLQNALKERGVNKISDFKKFFGSFNVSLISDFYNLEREVSIYRGWYIAQVRWEGFVSYQVYSNTLKNKINEWRSLGSIKNQMPLNMTDRFPWLLNLKSINHSQWGTVNFLLPYKAADLDMWSNTMNHCIRTYKDQIIGSQSMILVSLVTNEKLMLGTLELHAKGENLSFTQSVGYGNEHLTSLDPELHKSMSQELNRAISHGKEKVK